MKIKKVIANNRKKSFEIYMTTGPLFHFPYSRLKAGDDKIEKVFVDDELGGEAFTIVFSSHGEETIHLDQILEYVHDQNYLREMLLYKLTLQAQKALQASKVSKREIIRRLSTSPTHFYRLINPAFYHKTVDQMIKLLSALDCAVDVVFKKAA